MTSGAQGGVAEPHPQGEVVFRTLLPGDHLPSLIQVCGENPRFAFDTMAGRYQLYGFFLAAEGAEVRDGLEAVLRRRDLFDDVHCAFVGVSITPADRRERRFADQGLRVAWDFDLAMSRACGAVPAEAEPGRSTPVRRMWVLVDPSMHVIRVYPMRTTSPQEVIQAVADLPQPDRFGGVVRPAPILLLPNVFEPELCERLIAMYEAAGGEESGIYRGGQGVYDHGFKRRKDYTITDPEMLEAVSRRIVRRVTPEVEKLFFMRANWIERQIIGCYSAEDGGHFAPHTDNGPGATAHRRFAVSVNLSGGFEGGEVVFPEYNLQGYKAPPGWAVVFPCAILHAVRRVTRGRRYAYLPFIYDEGGRAIREAERARAAAPSG